MDRGTPGVLTLGPGTVGQARHSNTITSVVLFCGGRWKPETWHTRLDGINNPLASYYRFGCTKFLLPTNSPQFNKIIMLIYVKLITLIFARERILGQSEFFRYGKITYSDRITGTQNKII